MTELQHFEELLRCDHSLATVKSYLIAVGNYLLSNPGAEPEKSIRQYLLSLKDKSPRSLNLYRAAIIKFYSCQGVIINTREVPKFKEPKSLPRILSPEIVRKAIRKCQNPRHRLILSLFYGCGLRAAELHALRSSNIVIRDEKLHYLKLEATKGLRERVVPIPKSIRGILYSYAKGKDYLFRDMSREAIRKAVERAFEVVGVKTHPHALRHSFATDQLARGQDIKRVKEWLGHADLKTTEVYLHLNESHLNTAADLLAEDLL